MGAQSVKIPVELEIQSLQGEVSRMRKMLGELKPNTKAFQDLEKRIDKVNHSLISLENRSKQTFSNQSEITNFSKSFDKVGLAIQDIYTEFQRLDFKDLQLSNLDPGIQQLEVLGNQIKDIEKKIKNVDIEVLNDKNIISDDTLNTIKQLDPAFDSTKASIESCFKTLSQELKKVNAEITDSISQIKKLETAYNAAEEVANKKDEEVQNLTNEKGQAKNQKYRAEQAKINRDLVQARKLALELKAENSLIDAFSKASVENLTDEKQLKAVDTLFDKLINRADRHLVDLEQKLTAAQRLQAEAHKKSSEIEGKWIAEQQKNEDLEQRKSSIQSAETNLQLGEQDSLNRIQAYQAQIDSLIIRVTDLEEQIRKNNIVTKEAGEGQQEAAEAIKTFGDKIEESTGQINHLAEAQEKLDNVKHAIKNWFGFNEVINMSKNAVRNAITHIRELDKTMTEIAIVTDMTQQELWGQIDVYSALAQQYGATTKGVYEVSQLYYQQGLQTAEVMDLTSETLKMARISSLSYSDATDYMTVALRGFKLEMSDAQNIVDVYSNIAAVSASDTEELAVAMSKTASSAEAVGASFENTTAMIALMVETTREAPENIGSALKSIISRYGEMTSDPMKLVDSEGEEMSLNKVDKALQSVGISLQDAQGQFRNFDDVILELAESWDTIDKNTQRYIATVMAGNRQQSRFLALVGNYDRLKELTEEAANSEDAAQLQILKTMDSIETKLNQLKVTYQEFYTNTGVEEFIKGFLDFTTNVIKGLNDIPKTFNKLPVAAISTVSIIIKVIKASLTSIVAQINATISQESNKLKQQAAKDGTTHGRTYAEKFKAAMQGIGGRNDGRGILSGALSVTGAAISTLGLSLSGVNQQISQMTTGIGNAIAGVGSILTGGPMGWVTGIISILSGAMTIIDGAYESTAEKIERLTEEKQKFSDEALLAKNEYKTLNDYKDKLEQLTKARYNSDEAYQEWLDLNNEIASKYPELISSIDNEGNALVTLTGSYDALSKARLKASEASEQQIKTSIELAKEQRKQAKDNYEDAILDLGNKLQGSSIEEIDYLNNSIQALDDYLKKFDISFSKLDGGVQDKIYGALYSQDWISLQNTLDDIAISQGADLKSLDTSEVLNSIFNAVENYNDRLVEETETIDFSKFEGLEEFSDKYKEIDFTNINSILDFSKYLKESEIEIKSSAEKAGPEVSSYINGIYTLVGEILSSEAGYEAAKRAVETEERLGIAQKVSNKGYAKTFEDSSYDFLDESNAFNEIITQNLYNNFEQLKEEAIKIGNIEFSLDDYANFESDYEEIAGALRDAYDSLSLDADKQSFINIIENLQNYSLSNLTKGLTDLGLKPEAINTIVEVWERDYSNAYDNFLNAREEQLSKLTGAKILGTTALDELAPKYYSSVLEQFAFINSQIENKLIKSDKGQTYADNLIKLWEKSETDLKFGDLLQEADLTSLSGIYDFRQAVIDAGYSINDFDEELKALAANIKINVVTETDSLISKLNTSFKTFGEEIAKAGEGMDLEEALKIAEKLDMSIADFKFEDGEFKMEGEPNFQKLYDAYVGKNNELQQQLKNEIEAEINRIRTAIQDGTATKEDLDTLETLKILNLNLDKIVGDYNKQLLQTFLLQNKSYQEYFNNLFSDKQISEADTNELVAAARQGEQEFRNLLTQKGLEMTNASVEAFMGTIEGTYDDIIGIINEGKGLVSLTEFDWSPEDSLDTFDSQAVQEFYQKLFAGNHEKFNEAWIGYLENQEVKAGATIADIASSLDSIDIGAIGELANSLNTEITNILGYFHLEDNGSYTSSENEIRALMQQFNIQTTAEIEDALKEYLNNIISIVSNGIEGSMTNVEFESLNEFFDGRLALEFTETSEGLKLTKASAIEVYTELKKIDSIQAQITFSNLAESLEEAGSGYEDVASTMKTIAELNEEIADVPVDSKRREELERELDVAKEILRVRSQDPNSFDFMGKDLPDALKGPENYWNSVGEAYKVMNESAKSGYMEIQDYYNIINHMSSMIEASGGNLEWMGMNAKNASERAAELIRMGMGALSNVDGEGVKINLEELGADFDLGAEGMADGFASGIQEVAKSQVEMLDAAIQMLETIVAMEEIGNIDTEGNGIDLGNIFNNENPLEGYTVGYETWRNSIIEAAGKNEELKTAFESVFIEGRSLWELLNSDAEAFKDLSQEALQNYADSLEAIRQLAESDNYDLDNLLTSIDDLITKSGLAATINYTNENGTQIIVKPGEPSVAIEWESDYVKDLLKDKSEEEVEQIKQLVNDWANGKTLEPIEMVTIYQLMKKVTVDNDGNYTFMGQKFGPGEEEKLGQAIIESEKIKSELPEGQDFKLEKDNKGNITYTTTYGVNNKVELTVDENGGVTYTFGEYSGKSIDEVIDKYWADNEQKLLSYGTTKEQFITTFKGTVGIEAQPKLLTSEVTGKEGLTQEIIDEYGIDTSQVNTIAAAFSTVDWSPIGEKIAEGISKALTTVGEGTDTETGIPIGELTLKPEGLKVDTSETGEPTLLNAGEDLAVIPVDSVILKPTNYNIDLSSSTLSETASSGLEIIIPEGLNSESIDLINQFNAAISTAATNKVVETGIITNTTIPIDTLNNIVLLKNALSQLKANPTIETSIKAQAEGNALTIIQDILAVYGYDGKTAELIFNALDNNTINDIITKLNEVVGKDITITANLEDSEAEKAIEDLVKPETKLVTVQYTNPSRVGPDIDNNTVGYEVYGYDNLNGNFSRVGKYESAEQTIGAVTAAVSTGTFQDGNFEITEIKADGTTATINATSAELVAGVVSLIGGTNNPNSTNNNTGNQNSIIDTTILDQANLAISDAVTFTGEKLQTLAEAIESLPNKAEDVQATADAISNLKKKTVSVSVSYPKKVTIDVDVNVSSSGGKVSSTVTKQNTSTGGAKVPKPSDSSGAERPYAKGNVALASGSRKTLMGELGPELVVSNGRYFVVGQNGAEFVDLADDAIVFNHLQTKKLLGSGKSGYGNPVTNERNAVSFATGNVDGPAMASASAALAQLRQIRAMWQALLNTSAKDLGSLAGAGSGGGGGGGGDEVASILGDLDRWYNLLRQINSLEQHITLEQAKRANMKSGYDIVKSREKELAMLEKQKAAYEELNTKQKEYYDARREDLLESDYSQIFTYDEHGLMQYNEEEGKGLDILSALNATDSKGKATMNAKEQLAYLKSIGFDTSILEANEDGTKAKSEEDQMKNFWDGIDSWVEEMDGLYDSYHEAAINSEKATEQMNEILQEYIEERLEVEEKLKQAIEAREQAEIDRLEKEKESIEEATEAYISGLNQALDKEKNMYDKEQNNKDLTQLQNRLAILQRSGGSASEIKSLQDQINSRLKDAYFQEQQEQIDAIQEASDKQIEKLQEQIDIMQETLDYDKANGLFWEEVYSMLSQWTPDELLNFIQSYDPSYKEDSKTQNEEKDKETLTQLEGVRGKDYINEYGVFKENTLSKEYGEEILSRYDKEAEELYINSRKEGLTQAESENKVHEKISESVKAQDNVDTFIAELETQLGDLGLKNEWSKIYLDAYAAIEGTESEKIKNAKNAVINSIKSSKWAEAPTSSQVKTVKKGYLYKDEGGKRSISKGKKITLTGADTLEDGTPVFTAKYTASHGSSYTGYITTDMVENGSDLHKQMSLYKKIENLKGYSSGGLVDYTGLAMVHGSKSKPESFIDAEDTKILRETIFSKNNNFLKELQNLLTNYRESMKNINNENNSNINIENVNISVRTDAISNGYDARRAGQEIFDEMVRISRKIGNVKLSRR